MDNIHNFSSASEQERLIFGACRPGYNSNRVAQDKVDQWIDFMRKQDIRRVVCLLSDSQLAYYDDLLASYRKVFGATKVCWAPIEDFHLASPPTLIEKILPFLADAEQHMEKTVVHCSGGIGRTGHVLAAWLVSCRGMSNTEAIKAVRKMGRKAEESHDENLNNLLDSCRKSFAR